MLRSINQAEYFVFERTCGINDTVVPGPPSQSVPQGQGPAPGLSHSPHSPKKRSTSPFYSKGTCTGPFLTPCSEGFCTVSGGVYIGSRTTSEPLVKSVFVHLDIWEENQYKFCSDLAG